MFQRQIHLLQYQPHPLGVMMKALVNRFGCPGNRAASSPGKLYMVAINDPFIDLNYTVHRFQHESTYGKFNSTDKLGMGSLSLTGWT
jgi:glyceraldehyde 3-phosphate dehydrogenase